jgi:hypothetical protein
MHSFLELGEKAAAIREQEAYGELCDTFDDWIKSEGFGHTFIYDCMKAARIFRLTAPIAEPLKIVLNRESHYRDFPADVEQREAKKIIARLEQDVEPGEDGVRRPTAKQVKAAVNAVCGPNGIGPEKKKTAAARPDVPDSIEPEIVDRTEPSAELLDSGQSFSPKAPRLAPDTITSEYCEVQPAKVAWEGKLEIWAEDLHAFRSQVATMFLPLFQQHGHDQDFLVAAAKVFKNWSEEVANRQPTRKAK